jgi:hypothetical protein
MFLLENPGRDYNEIKYFEKQKSNLNTDTKIPLRLG